MRSITSALVLACVAAVASATDAHQQLPSPVVGSRRALRESGQQVLHRRPCDFPRIINLFAGIGQDGQIETCNDGKLSARLGETGVDCGGSCADDLDQLCAAGQHCRRNADCMSGICRHDGDVGVCSDADRVVHAAGTLSARVHNRFVTAVPGV